MMNLYPSKAHKEELRTHTEAVSKYDLTFEHVNYYNMPVSLRKFTVPAGQKVAYELFYKEQIGRHLHRLTVKNDGHTYEFVVDIDADYDRHLADIKAKYGELFLRDNGITLI